MIQTHKGQRTEQIKDTKFYSGIVKVRTDVTRRQVDRNFVRLISLEDDSRCRPSRIFRGPSTVPP